MQRRSFLASLGGAAATGILPNQAYAADLDQADLIPINGMVVAENAFVGVYVNGAPFCLSGALRAVSFVYPILSILKDGENRLDYDYQPFNNSRRNFTPHDGVRVGFEASVSRGDEVTLLSAQYSEAKAAMLPSDLSLRTDAPALRGDSYIRAGTTFSAKPSEIQFRSSMVDENVQRLSTNFQINMPELGNVPWAGTEDLRSDADIRQQLYAAYQALHRILDTKDFDGFVELARPSLLRTAQTTGYPDERYIAKRVFEVNPMGGHRGSRMVPLMNWSDFQAQPLRWGSTGQLVACFADPIQYVDIASGEKTGGMRVFFARRPGEALKICYSIDSGQ